MAFAPARMVSKIVSSFGPPVARIGTSGNCVRMLLTICGVAAAPDTFKKSAPASIRLRISMRSETIVAIIKNINADAVIAVYPFTPQPTISQAIIGISDVPVFVGVGGGITGGDRSVRLAIEAENQGAFGVVVNAPISDEVISRIKEVVDIPVIATIVSERMDIRSRMEAGADFLNVSGAAATPQIVRSIRAQFPDVPILATGGPNEKTILETIRAGANAITYSPPSNGELFADIMQKYRGKL